MFKHTQPRKSTHNTGTSKSILSKHRKHTLPFSLTTNKGIRVYLLDEVGVTLPLDRLMEMQVVLAQRSEFL
jgi:hypothetical protein